MEKLTIIKVGGKIVEEQARLEAMMADFAKIEGKQILVHGGGRAATKLAAQMGIETKMVDGRRSTDDNMLPIVTMVYGGLVNKKIVAHLQSLGINAIGKTGAEMNIVLSDKRPVKTVDYGWVGDVKAGDGKALASLLESGVCPVVAPLTHAGKGHILNTNADTMAGEVAKEMAKEFDVTLMYCFEKAGVLADENDDNRVIPQINAAKFEALKADGTISGGMIPKLENSLACVAAGVTKVVITSADLHAANTATIITE